MWRRMASPLETHATPKREHLPAYPGRASKLMVLWKGGAACVTRTRDPLITNEVLYRLS